MSLRSIYGGALAAKLEEARLEGRKLVIDSTNEPNPVPGLEAAFVAAANSGKKTFTYSTSSIGFQPADLRLQGPLFDALKTGIIQGLAEQGIGYSEMIIALNTLDQQDTKIDMTFMF